MLYDSFGGPLQLGVVLVKHLFIHLKARFIIKA